MSSETLKLTAATIKKMQAQYDAYLVKPVPYSKFRAQKNGITITAYTSGKVLFQGQNIESEVSQWRQESKNSPSAKASDKATKKVDAQLPQGFENWTIIGSDEVGNGSYFGALTVCAVYLPKEQIPLIKELGVKDSKMLSDAQIRELAWQIKATVPYHLTNCSPAKYNEANESRNANAIKVSLHNFTLQKLLAKLNETQKNKLEGILIDQFTPPNNYYKHLKNEDNPYKGEIYFAQKGESKHLAVACASIIARDAFLESLEMLGKPYGLVLPSGAGVKSDQVAMRLINRYGTSILQQTAKLHFANTQKALKLAGK